MKERVLISSVGLFRAHHAGGAAFPGDDGRMAKTFSYFVLGGESSVSFDNIPSPFENDFRLNQDKKGFCFFRVRTQR